MFVFCGFILFVWDCMELFIVSWLFLCLGMMDCSCLVVCFVLLLGVFSLFVDFMYEGLCSMFGFYLGLFGVIVFVVGVIIGLGEFFGYVLCLFFGCLVDSI